MKSNEEPSWFELFLALTSFALLIFSAFLAIYGFGALINQADGTRYFIGAVGCAVPSLGIMYFLKGAR